jgi:hypothetical protein
MDNKKPEIPTEVEAWETRWCLENYTANHPDFFIEGTGGVIWVLQVQRRWEGPALEVVW